MTHDLDMNAIIDTLKNGKKIQAIKDFRDQINIDDRGHNARTQYLVNLKHAKQIIDCISDLLDSTGPKIDDLLVRENDRLIRETNNLAAINDDLKTSLRYWQKNAGYWSDEHDRIINHLRDITNQAASGKLFPIVCNTE
jgi:hypothetical protein